MQSPGSSKGAPSSGALPVLARQTISRGRNFFFGSERTGHSGCLVHLWSIGLSAVGTVFDVGRRRSLNTSAMSAVVKEIVGPKAKSLARCPAREISRTYNEERGLTLTVVSPGDLDARHPI